MIILTKRRSNSSSQKCVSLQMQSSNSDADLLEFTTILSSHKDTEAPRCQTMQSHTTLRGSLCTLTI